VSRMCDIYVDPCYVCGKWLPVHLGDFKTPRQDIVVFCEKHIPESNARVCTFEKRVRGVGRERAIRSLTDTARKNIYMNFPNTMETFTNEDI